METKVHLPHQTLKSKFMRHLFITMIVFFSCISSYANMISDSTSDSKVDKRKCIIIERTYKHPQIDRNFIEIIDTYIYENSIELTLCNLGETTVYIVDSHNQIVDTCTINTETQQWLTMNLPEKQGHYWLIIDSSVLYGEGEFTIE